MKTRRVITAGAALLHAGPSYGQDDPLAKYLEVPGAKATLPISTAKSPFSLEFTQQARKSFESFHYQMGGDHAVYSPYGEHKMTGYLRRAAKYPDGK